MENNDFVQKYWKELKPFVGNMISEAPLHSNKHEYVQKCWNKLSDKLKSYELEESDFRGIYAKLRRQIEDEILR